MSGFRTQRRASSGFVRGRPVCQKRKRDFLERWTWIEQLFVTGSVTVPTSGSKIWTYVPDNAAPATVWRT